MRITDSVFDIDDKRLEYRCIEPDDATLTTDALVMLHEGLGSIDLWKSFPEDLAKATGCRVFIYSRYGYGRSTALSEKRSVEYMHDEALNVLPNFLKHIESDFNENYNTPSFSGFPVEKGDNNENKNDNENPDEINIIKESIFINASITCLSDLIELCEKYPLHDNVEYNINMKAIHDIKPSLIELQNMIGMNSIKENIVDQILYFVQDLHHLPNYMYQYKL